MNPCEKHPEQGIHKHQYVLAVTISVPYNSLFLLVCLPGQYVGPVRARAEI